VRRVYGYWVALLLSCLSLAGLAAPTESDATAKTQELADLRTKIKALRQTMDEQTDQRSRAQTKLRALDRDIAKVAQKLQQTSAALATSDQSLAQLQQQRHTLEAGLNSQRTLLRESLAATYALGQQPELKLLLSQDDLSQASRLLVYQRYFTETQQHAIAKLQADTDQLAALEQQTLAKQQETQTLKDTLTQQQAALQAQRETRKKALTELQAELKSTEQQLGEWRQNERDLQRLLTDIQQVLEQTRRRQEEVRRLPDAARSKAAPAFSAVSGRLASARGKLPWPVSGPFLANYGQRRTGGNTLWRGAFIGATEGADVRAIADGEIVFADWLRGFGNLLIIDHGDGFMSLYGYNQNLAREVGEAVRSGDVVAAAGVSGGQTQSGVYFELRHHGEPIDPGQWCR
jgi:murein hydrolase activator